MASWRRRTRQGPAAMQLLMELNEEVGTCALLVVTDNILHKHDKPFNGRRSKAAVHPDEFED